MKAETVFSQESFIRRADDDDEVLELDAWTEERRRGSLADVKFLGLDVRDRQWHHWVDALEEEGNGIIFVKCVEA